MKSVRLKAELDMLELEEELVAAKESGEVTTELKLRVREARQRFREMREQGLGGPWPSNRGEGDATVGVQPVSGKAKGGAR